MKIREEKEATVSNDTELPNFIASNLKVLRKHHGWSQAELARRVNLNRGNIASYESGAAEPSICNLLKISNLFQVHMRDITRRDFSEASEIALAQHTHNDRVLRERERVAKLRNRAMELDELIQSSRKLFEYKRSRIAKPCKEADIFAAQYQQLFEISNQLIEEHRALLSEVGCHCE